MLFVVQMQRGAIIRLRNNAEFLYVKKLVNAPHSSSRHLSVEIVSRMEHVRSPPRLLGSPL